VTQAAPQADAQPGAGREWTDVEQVRARLRRQWDRGHYLHQHAAGTPWAPVTVPVRGPTAAELLDRFDEARQWVANFQRKSRTAGGTERFSIEYRTVQGRNLGSNAVPARIRIDRFEQLCAFLGTTQDVQALDGLMAETRARLPTLHSWVVHHPLLALARRDIWDELLATVGWIAAHDTGHVFLRQIDIDGVDTKFVERHQKLLSDLLTEALPPGRIATQYNHTDFARRFGFLPKPTYARFRLLDPSIEAFPEGLSELTLRTDELARIEPDVTTVFIVENEITYLAFPLVADSLVVFGSGFDLARLTGLAWLQHKRIVYWGDIDTHGFGILDRLRARFGSVQSLLMDQRTLLAHPTQWVTEPSPTSRPLAHLTDAEATLYADLIEGRYGAQVRLEQERVRFSLLRRALEPLGAPL
jgi:hypothetical protein